MRAPLALPFAALVVGVIAGACVGDEGREPQDPACQAVLECYFNDPDRSLRDVPGFLGLFPADDPTLVQDTYGATGSCWRGGEEIARSCADRCKGLLWADCARSYQRACEDSGGACFVDEDCPVIQEPVLLPGDRAQRPPRHERCEAVLVDEDGAELPFCADACTPAFALSCNIEADGRVSACPDGAQCNAQGNGTSGCCEIPARGEEEGLVGDRETCLAPPPVAP